MPTAVLATTTIPTMGSNVSRHSGKGLSGRRAASSGSLCAADRIGRLLAPCHHRRRSERDGGGSDGERHHRDRYKLCGSLPSHLDSGDVTDNNNILPSPAVSEKDVQLRLHSLMVSTDLGDQGYASERSPDEDAGLSDTPASPSPPGSPSPSWLRLERAQHVPLRRGPRGLGLSVCGGVDASPDGLVRIKRLFPHQPAWQSGRLAPGDVLLAVNGISLAGLSNHAALEVLRTATPADKVVLTVVRPPPPPMGDAMPTPPASPMPPPPPRRQDSVGELEVVLTKVHGSLGFTLRKEDSSVLGHYVRALVREPALSDGRVRPGDKIVAVNGVDMANLSHEEAVAFLRRCGDVVTLRLWRDAAPTPLYALSPTESRAPSLGALSSPVRPKPLLRKEAMDMLSVLAERKRLSPASPLTSSSSDARSPIVSLADSTTRSSSPMSASSNASVLTEVELPINRARRPDSLNLDNQPLHRARWKLQRLSVSPGDAVDGQGEIEWDSSETPSPPGSPHTAVNCRKNHIGSRAKSNSIGDPDQVNAEFSSLPPLQNDAGFSHRNPAYQSAHATCRVAPSAGTSITNANNTAGASATNCIDVRTQISDPDLPGLGKGGRQGLLKWKGVVFTPDETTSSVNSSDLVDKSSTDFDNESLCQLSPDDTNGQVLTVELTRGWNSRLGFSLKADKDGLHSSISAIYDESVAAKDGRLRIGDTIIMVNDDSVEGMQTADLIDLFRKIRGSVAITIWRRDSVSEKNTPKTTPKNTPRNTPKSSRSAVAR